MLRSIAHFSAARSLLYSILLAIGCGTVLLKLPVCHTIGISWIDALFTTTSCLCICGLSTVPFLSFTLIGQCILLILIQVGGLGLVTLTFFFMSFFFKFGFTTQIIAGQLMELESWKDIKKFIFFIIFFTGCIELIGAIGTFFSIYHDYSLLRAIFLSLFHAVATFCDAGVSLFPEGMITYRTHYMMLLFDCFIMISGGLGFFTWYELFKYVKTFREKKRFHFSLQTKIVLYMTCILIFGAVLIYWMLERNNTLASMSPLLAIVNAFFNGIASRGTGFSTVHSGELQLATLLLIMVVSFIGSAPGSTGSGIKITTFALFVAIIKSAISGRTSVSMMGRSIAKDQIFKALAIPSLALFWIVMTTFFLLITEEGWSFIDILFESVSAFATLGLSTGLTPALSVIGKFFIILSMIIGRLGALAFVLALYKRHEIPEFSYPEERIIVG
jgi:trk system potassium uptake protein